MYDGNPGQISHPGRHHALLAVPGRGLLEELPRVAAAGGKSSSCSFAAKLLPFFNMMSASPLVPHVQHLMRRVRLADFMSHCIGALQRRCKETYLPDCCLALFLDPRFKAAADAPGTSAELMIMVRFYPDVKASMRLCFHTDKDATLSTGRMSMLRRLCA